MLDLPMCDHSFPPFGDGRHYPQSLTSTRLRQIAVVARGALSIWLCHWASLRRCPEAAERSVPFSLDPMQSLREPGRVHGDTVVASLQLVALFLLCVASGAAAESIALDYPIPVSSKHSVACGRCIPCLGESTGQDADALACSLVHGVSVCKLSALRRGGRSGRCPFGHGAAPDLFDF